MKRVRFRQCSTTESALNIHALTRQRSDPVVINEMLKLCQKQGNPNVLSSMWSCIEHAINKQRKISYPLLLKCCIDSGDHAKSMQVLQWIEHCNYTLKIHDRYIRKLLSQCNDRNDISFIHRLLCDHFIEHNDRWIKPSLISAFGRCGDIDGARNAFKSTPDSEKDIFIIAAMMKVFVNHKHYKDALDLYRSIKEYNRYLEHDDVSNMLALRACIHDHGEDNQDIGRSIIDSITTDYTQCDHQLINTMIDFFGSFNDVDGAWTLFQTLQSNENTMIRRRISTFNAMMNAFIVNGKYTEALSLFDQLEPLSIPKDITTYLYALKACSNTMDIERGNTIIQCIEESLTLIPVELKTAILHFYGSCGDVENAEKTYHSLPPQQVNEVNTTAMMNVYIRSNRALNALKLYDAIKGSNDSNSDQSEDLMPHILALKAYGRISDLEGGRSIHRRYAHHLGSSQHSIYSIPFKNALIDFYGTLNRMDLAEEVFQSESSFNSKNSKNSENLKNLKNPKYDVVTIGSMMKGYINSHRFDDALRVYDDCPDYIPLNSVCHRQAIRACCNYDAQKGAVIIADKINIQQASISMKHTLIDFYLIAGRDITTDIANAKMLFLSIPEDKRDIALTNKMMNALILNGTGRKGVNGQNYHDHRDTEDALQIYDTLQSGTGIIHKNEMSHIIGLKACGRLGRRERGRIIHDEIKREGLEESIHLKAALIDFYGKCLELDSAKNVFESIKEEEHNIVTVSCMMNAYLLNAQYKEVLNLFDTYCNWRYCTKTDTSDSILIVPDRGAYLLALKACGQIGNMEYYHLGKEIIERLKALNLKHGDDEIEDNDLKESDLVDIAIKTAVIDFYGKCKEIESAESVFMTIEDGEQNIMSIGAMMNAYFVNQQYTECINLFQEINHLKDNVIEPDLKAYRLVLAASARSDVNFTMRQQLHEQMKGDRNGQILARDTQIQCSLIQFYSQNGMMDECREIFDQHTTAAHTSNGDGERYRIDNSCRSLTVWHAMLQALGRNGLLDEAKALFYRLKKEGEKDDNLRMDQYSYSIVMSACSHCGDMQSAMDIWNEMEKELKSIKYDPVIITSLVDGLSRRGHLNASWELIAEYEKHGRKEPYDAMWRALLSASVRFNEVAMAEFVYGEYKRRLEKYVKESCDSEICSAASIMANMYASSGMFDRVEEFRAEMTMRGWKTNEKEETCTTQLTSNNVSENPDPEWQSISPCFITEDIVVDELDLFEEQTTQS